MGIARRVGCKPTSSQKGSPRSESNVSFAKSDSVRTFVPHIQNFIIYWIPQGNCIKMFKRVVSFCVTGNPVFFQYSAMPVVLQQREIQHRWFRMNVPAFFYSTSTFLGAAVDFGSRNMALGKCPGSWAMANSYWWEECVLGITVLGYSALVINAFLNRRNRWHLTKESKIMSECERASVELVHGIVPNAKVPEYRFRGHLVTINDVWTQNCLKRPCGCTFFCEKIVEMLWFVTENHLWGR